MATHHLDDSVTQPYWDNSVEPRLVIAPGDTVVFECLDASGQLSKNSSVDDYLNVDRSMIHALNGSVFVDGAEPGDALQVEILDMQHKGWGWTAFKSGFGLLADDFPDAHFHIWELEGEDCHFGVGDIVVPFEPMPGCVGVALAEDGRFNTIPPRANGGNVDIRDLTTGSTFWLPVLVPGALFSTGDCHAAQGQGEVCGTGIECPMTVTMRFDVRKDMAVKELQYHRPSPISKVDGAGYHATTAHGPDLFVNSQNAIRYMIEWLVSSRGLTAAQAYLLCSAAANLHISEIVDQPNWVVSAHMPLAVFPA
ncbi:MAG: acetamidase/formamidase family protein [Alphaproteobacteria bacterium]|nr:acetamidase/formamidase family protein [Alphaproteobacteria bacterium]